MNRRWNVSAAVVSKEGVRRVSTKLFIAVVADECFTVLEKNSPSSVKIVRIPASATAETTPATMDFKGNKVKIIHKDKKDIIQLRFDNSSSAEEW